MIDFNIFFESFRVFPHPEAPLLNHAETVFLFEPPSKCKTERTAPSFNIITKHFRYLVLKMEVLTDINCV